MRWDDIPLVLSTYPTAGYNSISAVLDCIALIFFFERAFDLRATCFQVHEKVFIHSRIYLVQLLHSQ